MSTANALAALFDARPYAGAFGTFNGFLSTTLTLRRTSGGAQKNSSARERALKTAKWVSERVGEIGIAAFL